MINLTLLPFLFQKQLADFDAKTEDVLAQAEQELLPSLEVKHAYARLELREKQLQELAGTMKDLTTEEVCEFFSTISLFFRWEHVATGKNNFKVHLELLGVNRGIHSYSLHVKTY